jgi:hypothetical protein
MSLTTFEPSVTPTTITSFPLGSLTTEPLALRFDPLGASIYVQYANTEAPPPGAPPKSIKFLP